MKETFTHKPGLKMIANNGHGRLAIALALASVPAMGVVRVTMVHP